MSLWLLIVWAVIALGITAYRKWVGGKEWPEERKRHALRVGTIVGTAAVVLVGGVLLSICIVRLKEIASGEPTRNKELRAALARVQRHLAQLENATVSVIAVWHRKAVAEGKRSLFRAEMAQDKADPRGVRILVDRVESTSLKSDLLWALQKRTGVDLGIQEDVDLTGAQISAAIRKYDAQRPAGGEGHGHAEHP
jgi:hypothetical protein